MEIREFDFEKNSDRLSKILNQHQLETVGKISPTEPFPFSFAIYDEANYVGGITGSIWGNTMHVGLLAVEKAFRGQGFAKKLLNRAKDFAYEHDCRFITISTQKYQALDVYQHYGFTIFAEIPDMPFEGTTKYFLMMDLKN